MPELPLTDCRLLVDLPGGGAWNMAVDEYLLGWTSETGRCCWRFYQWNQPTLSLGYFQKYAEREGHSASRDCATVRRASGGGAILHDRELTYSLTVPLAHPLGNRRQWTYEAVHLTLIDVLSEWAVDARLFGTSVSVSSSREFLCFRRRSSGDVVVGDVKIAGSAQRRTANAVLQHGSVLLQRSPCAPELAGLREITGKTIGQSDLVGCWKARLAEVLGFCWHAEELSVDDEEPIHQIVSQKYGNPVWTEKPRK